MDVLLTIIPNVLDHWPEFTRSIWETLYMTGLAGGISFLFGLLFGVTLIVTCPGGILENKPIFWVLDKIINLFRSIPFIVLLAALVPLTRLVVGTSIGTKGTILPLVFGTVPFFSRQIESALASLDSGLIEAAQSMGDSPWQIIHHVYLGESIAEIIRAVSITLISLIGLTAMAGAVGGGGLGDFAIRYGHQRGFLDATYMSVLVLLVIVTLIQWICELGIKRNTH